MSACTSRITAALLLSFISASCSLANVSEETARDMTTIIEEYVSDLIADEMGDGVKAQIKVSNLEKRQRVDECDGDLEVELVKKDLTRFSNSVKLICSGGEKQWNAVVPIKIIYTSPAVTLKVPVAKNQTITEDCIELAEVDKKNLRGNYFSDPILVIGSKAKRDIPAGAVIKTNQICLVCKDDVVDLEAGTGEVTIKVQALALEDGSLNSNVKVKNLISQKNVTGRVTGVKHVRMDVK